MNVSREILGDLTNEATTDQSRSSSRLGRGLNNERFERIDVSNLVIDSLAFEDVSVFDASNEFTSTQQTTPVADGIETAIAISNLNIRNWGIKARTLTNGVSTSVSACGCGSANCNCNGRPSFADYNNTSFNFGAISNTLVDLDQVVFLDFDTNADPSPMFPQLGPLNYTAEMRVELRDQLNEIFRNFGVTFVNERPDSGDFSTVLFRTTPASGATGTAIEGIDFRNQNKNDTVIMNILIGSQLTPDSPAFQVVEAARNVAAHEIGHALGLRHHDSFGPIGTGVPDPFFFGYPGPTDAVETRFHVINTPVFGGDPDFFGDRFFGARESAKLTFAAIGESVFESTSPNGSFAEAQPIDLELLVAPNAIEFGRDADSGDFVIEAANVIGSFDFFDTVDYYSFEGQVGRAYSFEVISDLNPRFADFGNSVDPTLAIYNSSFELVDYYGDVAFNDDDLEFGSFDSHIFDLLLPEDDTYFIEVDTFSDGEDGGYELFIQSIVALPFALPTLDDFTDNLTFDESEQLDFQENGSNFISRRDGTIGFEGNQLERDVFSFTIDSVSKVIVDVRTTTSFFDTLIEVFDSDNRRIAFNDNTNNPSFETPSDSQIVIKNLRAGDYYAVVSGVNETVGQYRLGVRHNGVVGEFDDHGDSLLTSTQIELNALPSTTFINASAELGTDTDVFAFTALHTGRVVVRSLGLSGDINTVLRGYDADQQLVAANNNFNDSLNSRISLDVISDETYFIRLSTVHDTSGDYRLSIRSVLSENTSTPGGEGDPLALGRISDPNIELKLDSGQSTFADSNSEAALENLGRVDQYDELTGGMLA